MRLHFLIISLAIISAGCISVPGTGSGGDGIGLSLNSLTFSPQKIGGNQMTRLMLSVENTGTFSIEENSPAYVFLYGLPSDWTTEQQPDANTFSMRAPGTYGDKKFPGEKKDFTWLLRAPSTLPRDETFKFEARTRVCYPYKTVVSGKLEVVSQDEWINSQPAQHQIKTQRSAGPLRVDILSTQPLIADTEALVKLRITNAGDGIVTGNDCSAFESGGLDMATGITFLNKLTIEGTACTFNSEGIFLERGKFKELTIRCTPPSLDGAPVKTDDFQIELNYNYYADAAATVLVEGTAEGSALVGGAAGGGAPSGGGASSKITLTDLCTKSCTATNQKYSNGKPAVGLCANKNSPSTVKYPGTAVDVVIDPLSSTNVNSLGLPATATIKSLNLHDATAGDIGFEKIRMKTLDTKSSSVQYEKNAKLKKPSVGIISGLCSIVPEGMTLTSDGYAKDSTCAATLEGKPISSMVSINGADGSQFKDSALSGLKITSIANRDISAITGGNLTAINIEDFKISALPAPPYNYMLYAKCSSSNVLEPYSRDVICQCIVGVSGEQYPHYNGISNAACAKACPRTIDGQKWADGGVCNAQSAGGTSQCRGTTLVTYHAGNTPTTPAGACGSNACLCYETKSMSSAEAALVCQGASGSSSGGTGAQPSGGGSSTAPSGGSGTTPPSSGGTTTPLGGGTTAPPTQTDNPPSVSASHSPSSPTTSDNVVITASATDDKGLSEIRIYVDSALKKTCTVSGTPASCSFSATFSAGTHSYYATAKDNAAKTATASTKSFSVSAPTPAPTDNPPSVSVSHSPANPTTAEITTINASAADDKGVTEIVVYVDNTAELTCTQLQAPYSCPYGTKFSAGTHSYYATAKDTAGQTAKSTTKSFSVTAAVCTPNWQCRQPLDGYEYDANICGSADRLNSACNPPSSSSCSYTPGTPTKAGKCADSTGTYTDKCNAYNSIYLMYYYCSSDNRCFQVVPTRAEECGSCSSGICTTPKCTLMSPLVEGGGCPPGTSACTGDGCDPGITTQKCCKYVQGA